MNFRNNFFVLRFRSSKRQLWVRSDIAIMVLTILVQVNTEHFPARATHAELQPNVLGIAIVNAPFDWHGQRVQSISGELKFAFRFVQFAPLGKAWERLGKGLGQNLIERDSNV